MPPRSVKMKRRILGFQRRVWWPKWTPASSSSRMETTDISIPFGWRVCCRRGPDGTGVRRTPAPPPVLRRRVGIGKPVNRSGGLLAGAFECGHEVARKRRFRQHGLGGEGMLEREARGVEELALEAELVRPAVDRIARDGEVDRREVHPDLMRAPRLEADIEECIPREELHDLEVRNGVPRRLRVERVPQWIAAVAADRCLDPPAAGPRTAHDECAVLPLERAPAHEGLEPPMRLVGARDDHQA